MKKFSTCLFNQKAIFKFSFAICLSGIILFDISLFGQHKLLGSSNSYKKDIESEEFQQNSHTSKVNVTKENSRVIKFNPPPVSFGTEEIILSPLADAFVRDGSYADKNYASETTILVKGSPNSGFTRQIYIKFLLPDISNITTAKLRIYGSNIDNSTSINVSVFGVSNDTWHETGITFNNAPGPSGAVLSRTSVPNQPAYYEFDVTDFTNAQLGGDKIVSLLLRDDNNNDKNVSFNSKENTANIPQLYIDTVTSIVSTSTATLLPIEDAFVRNGNYANNNYGTDTEILVKGSPNSGFTRYSCLKFSLGAISNINSAKLRLYGRNTDNTNSILVSAYGVDNDIWSESGITFNNAPSVHTLLGSVPVNNQLKYYEFDVSAFAKTQLGGDKVITLLLKDASNADKMMSFSSKENPVNRPELVLDTINGSADIIPPVVDLQLSGVLQSRGVYVGPVQITVNASDAGGSGLASTLYSLNNGPYQNYGSLFIISTAGNYVIKAKATDGNGNITVTNDYSFSIVNSPSGSNIELPAIADAFVRNGTYADNNYGSDTSFLVKGSPNSGFTRQAYIKFALPNITKITSAKLRIYGRNIDNSATISVSAYEVNSDSWTENGITFNNAPGASNIPLSNIGVNNQATYYEFEVTNFAKSQLAGDRIMSFLLKDPTNGDKVLSFNSRENTLNNPQLLIDTAAASSPTTALLPVADAYVRNGSNSNKNYGSDTSLWVKSSPTIGNTRHAFIKFALDNISRVSSARLRLYGSNIDNNQGLVLFLFGVNNDNWTESGITWNNAPFELTDAITQTSVSDLVKYYEFDVTEFVKSQFDADKVASFVIKDLALKDKGLIFKSKEFGQNKPELIIDTVYRTPSNAAIFIENPDKFPSNDHFVFSRVQVPWSRDSVHFNANHDSLKVRIHNKGLGTLTINNLVISNDALWKIDKLNGVNYIPGSGLPFNVTSGNFVDVTVKFIAMDQGNRVKILHEALDIYSNDDKFPIKTVFLDGLWQKEGEGDNEPYAREIIEAFGFTTTVGFSHTDPSSGDSTKLKGDEIKPSYFVRADNSQPVTVTQMGSYHGCCYFSEKLAWYPKGTTTLTTAVTHINSDAQTLLPRKGTPSTGSTGSFIPSGPFGFKIGSNDWTDAKKNPGYKIGVRVWKVYDQVGKIIPNTYIISNDYLGTTATNYDYNDNTYYIQNVRPEIGSVNYSKLNVSPSVQDFNEKDLQTSNSLTLNISSSGQVYSDGSVDPAIIITSLEIVGENKSEFAASLPANTTLGPQEASTININFNPVSQGFKSADLLIHYNNASGPLRIPLYGIAKATGVSVIANLRINSGSSSPVTINGKTWSADNQYSFDNLEPYTNPALTQINGTDEDILYLTEQSSNADKKPFRYEIPVSNGNYVVRLHFAEIYWGAPGNGLTGGTGSRVMSVKTENQYRLINFDLTNEVGGATAVIKNLPVTVTDGKLNIDFSATVNRPMVCAVEVYSFTNPPPPVTQKQTMNDSLNINNNAITHLSPLRETIGIIKPRVYPNPLHNSFSIELPGQSQGNYKIQIIDVFGRIYDVHQQAITKGGSSRLQVDITKQFLKPGIYFLRIQSDGTKANVIKLMIE